MKINKIVGIAVVAASAMGFAGCSKTPEEALSAFNDCMFDHFVNKSITINKSLIIPEALLSTLRGAAPMLEKADPEYEHGPTVPLSTAVSFAKRTDLQNPDVQLRLGLCYLAGIGGLNKDVSKGLELIAAASAAGHENAPYIHLGVLSELGDSAGLAEAAEKYSEGGNALATVMYGKMLMLGTCGVEKNEAKGVELLASVVDACDLATKTMLADAYMQGLGVAKDAAKAVQLYAAVADDNEYLESDEDNDARSAARLNAGLAFCEGYGVEKNIEKGVALLEKSGLPEAKGYAAQVRTENPEVCDAKIINKDIKLALEGTIEDEELKRFLEGCAEKWKWAERQYPIFGEMLGMPRKAKRVYTIDGKEKEFTFNISGDSFVDTVVLPTKTVLALPDCPLHYKSSYAYNKCDFTPDVKIEFHYTKDQLLYKVIVKWNGTTGPIESGTLTGVLAEYYSVIGQKYGMDEQRQLDPKVETVTDADGMSIGSIGTLDLETVVVKSIHERKSGALSMIVESKELSKNAGDAGVQKPANGEAGKDANAEFLETISDLAGHKFKSLKRAKLYGQCLLQYEKATTEEEKAKWKGYMDRQIEMDE